MLHLLLAKFTATLSYEQKKQFSLILKLITNKDNNEEENIASSIKKQKTDMGSSKVANNCNVKEFIPSKYLSSTYPLDESTIRRYYHDGRNSILRNLPQPNVTLIDNHSYVSIRQCIADF